MPFRTIQDQTDRGPIENQDVETMTDEQLEKELEQLYAKMGVALVPLN